LTFQGLEWIRSFNSLYMGFFSETYLTENHFVWIKKTFNSLYMGFFSETGAIRLLELTDWNYFQFPLYGIFLWNHRDAHRRRSGSAGLSIPSIWDFSLKRHSPFSWYLYPQVHFQFPLYGIFLWNAERRTVMGNMLTYFQFPLYGIFLWNHGSHTGLTVVLDVLSIPSIWDFSLKLEVLLVRQDDAPWHFQFPLYGIFLWNLWRSHGQARIVGCFQFPLYGIFLWNMLHHMIGETDILMLSIPSIWDFSLKRLFLRFALHYTL